MPHLELTEVDLIQRELADGGALIISPSNVSDGVHVARIGGDGKLAMTADLTPEEYDQLRAAHPELELPELPPRAPATEANGNTVGKVVAETPPTPVPAAEANPPVATETSAEAGVGSAVLDGVQVGLDVIGLIPAAGEVADLLNAGISALRGDYVGAALSLAAAIPFVGWGATAAKVAKRGADIVQAGAKGAKEVAQAAAKQADELAQAAAKQADEAAQAAAKQSDEAAAAAKKKADDEAAAAKKKEEEGGQSKKPDCKKWQKGPPGATHQGGRHGQVQKDSAALKRESHHIPPDSVTPKSISKVDGPAISMDYADHRALSSTGRLSTHPDSIAQAALAGSGPPGFLAAMTVEIAEIRKNHGNKYDAAIGWMLLYAACMGYIPSVK